MQKDINFFREEYKKQQKLEKIINSRILVKPNVKKWQVTVSFIVLPFLLSAIICLFISSNICLHGKILGILISILIVLETYLRFCCILTVKFYQATAKEETRRRCKCVPSCSEYAIISLKRIFPLLLALLKIRKRLYKTCNGEEYKIDFPLKKMGEDFENSIR